MWTQFLYSYRFKFVIVIPCGKRRERPRKYLQGRKESHAICTFKVLKQVHWHLLQGFVKDIFEGFAVALLNTGREIQTAVRLLLPGELAKDAVSEGT